MTRDVFQAIADPHRRTILNLLAQQPLPINGIAAHFAISRPAVSKHVKILVESGLVVIHQKGRERFCEVRPEKLDAVSDWLEQYRQAVEQRFDRLDGLLQELQQQENPSDP
ncbi:MAG: winged helix-turn-helix transcriptional regulator [Anaerolineales bacterium]|nr:winged helix-turn-helix transcriptional regulator [Anaerolineales bacterium]